MMYISTEGSSKGKRISFEKSRANIFDNDF